MTSGKRNILNQLLKQWPQGAVLVCSKLREYGISQQLLSYYVKSNWLRKIGQGAFIRAGDKVDWTGALYAIQTQLCMKVYVGGKTALEFSGIQHFFHLGSGGVVWLFGQKGEKLPRWFCDDNKLHRWNVKIKYITSTLFKDQQLGLQQREIGRHIITNSVVSKHLSDYSIVISSIERAILELLYLIPSEQSLEEAKYLMEGLMTMRPDLLQKLLENCNSIKTKRLFIFLADFCRLPCLAHLDLSKINLGNGKRVIGKGGYYIAKYQLSIPKNFVNTFKEEFESD